MLCVVITVVFFGARAMKRLFVKKKTCNSLGDNHYRYYV